MTLKYVKSKHKTHKYSDEIQILKATEWTATITAIIDVLYNYEYVMRNASCRNW